MKRSRWLPAMCLLWPLACGGENGTPTTRRYVASDACQLKTLVAWQQFLERSATDAAWVKTCSDLSDCESSAGAFAEHVQSDTLRVLSDCAADLNDHPTLAACTANLRRFAPAWLRQHASDSYGFEQANPAYFAAQISGETPPQMMDLPRSLLDALPARAAVEKAAQAHGWPFLTHTSCLGGVRTFVHVVDAEDRFEQWLLFGVDPAEPSLEAQDIVSFIAIQKRSADGAALDDVRLHFRDYTLAQRSERWDVDLPPNNEGKCYACHGSGLRQLLPYPTEVTASVPVRGEADYGAADAPADVGAERLAAFNAELEAHGLPDWDGTIEAVDYGPALGGALGCTSCHDGKTRGPLTVFTSEGMLYQKVVEQLSMRSFTGVEVVPDLPAMELLERERQAAGSLSVTEQQALQAARAQHQLDFDALMSSRLPELQAWLLTTRCDTL